jgi:acetoin:2,6-dichlorophenolindophenol oxidoreductase subunit alpha
MEKRELIEVYTRMQRMRKFEEEASRLYKEGLVTGSLHPYIGEEAIAATAIQLMKKGDMFTSTHRGVGHCVACGMDVNRMMAELFGRATGVSGGKGGSMHMFDLEKGNLGANGIVAGGTSIAVGAALTAKELKKNDAVVFCFFGEGASNEGVTHESMNLAAVWKLPVIFVCENNTYGMFTPMSRSTAAQDLASRAQGYGMPGVVVDGNDAIAVYETAAVAVDRARNGEGPTFIEAKTYRQGAHYAGDVARYQPKDEIARWQKCDPIARMRQVLIDHGALTEQADAALHAEIQQEIDDAVEFAENSPEPDMSEMLTDQYVPFKVQ